ncbi:MAG: amino acid racemase [Acidobacteriota bacterium]
MNNTIGIIGGMGPEATAYFYQLLIQNTLADKDQEHVPVIIYANPRVPPRTDAIHKKALSPVPFLVQGIKTLIRSGADFGVMPCITAHYFLPEALNEIDFPFVNLLDETLHFIRESYPSKRTVGLIASSGTVDSGLFHHLFERAGITLITPDSKGQADVHEAIFSNDGIKAGFIKGKPRDMIIAAAGQLIQQGAEAVIAGCSEVPLVLKPVDLPVPLIEPMLIGARICIKKAGFHVRPVEEHKKKIAEYDEDGQRSLFYRKKSPGGKTESQPCSRLTRLTRLARLATLDEKSGKEPS